MSKNKIWPPWPKYTTFPNFLSCFEAENNFNSMFKLWIWQLFAWALKWLAADKDINQKFFSWHLKHDQCQPIGFQFYNDNLVRLQHMKVCFISGNSQAYYGEFIFSLILQTFQFIWVDTVLYGGCNFFKLMATMD